MWFNHLVRRQEPSCCLVAPQEGAINLQLRERCRKIGDCHAAVARAVGAALPVTWTYMNRVAAVDLRAARASNHPPYIRAFTHIVESRACVRCRRCESPLGPPGQLLSAN